MKKSKEKRRKKWKGIYLMPFLQFLAERHPEGLSLHVLSEVWDMSPKAVSAMLMADDAKISKITHLVGRYGYRVTLVFHPSSNQDNGLKVPETVVWPNAGALSGLATYIQSKNWSVNYISITYGVSRNIIYRALHTGDIHITVLAELVRRMGIDVEWVFSK